MDEWTATGESLLNGQNLGADNRRLAPAAAPDVLSRTQDGCLTLWSSGMQRRYGFTCEQALGHTSHQLLKTIFPLPLNEIGAILDRQSNWSGGLINHHSDGRAVLLTGHWFLHRNIDGQEAVVTEVHSDAAGRGLADLVVMLAHQLSEPLTAINNYVTASQRMLDQDSPDRDSLCKAMALIAGQIVRGADGVRLMRELANELRASD
jgi:signal transduction histidine kinase